MKITKTKLDGVLIIELNIFQDSRVFFIERFHKEKFLQLGLPIDFVQDNHSKSKPGVLRGLHYQIHPSQGKLIGCINGEIQDVVVDLRPNSPTYAQYISETLSDTNGKLLWIPHGFAHGFCVTGNKTADVTYKVDNLYNAEGDKGIIWNDPELNIKWEIENPILSEKDKQLPQFNSLHF